MPTARFHDGAQWRMLPRGPRGREIEMQVSATHLQWRHVGDPAWNDLVSLATIANESDWMHVHTQETPAATWTISHGLAGYPNVTIVDSADRVVEGDVTYVSDDVVSIEFSAPFGGKAFLS